MLFNLILFYFLIINGIAFFVYTWDKRRANLKNWRVSEKTLLLLAALGGALGALGSMQLFRHKTQKISFTIAYTFTLFLNFLYFILLIHYRHLFL
jgi:uncharacterized membrane protein YsdA (DUF1294 family)